ncbi:ABC transporter ATP-binding protein [bacterium]|nr:MAG: ABC transporter ATP-binding protein [bacterium]
MSAPLLEIENVSRAFGGVRALDGVDLRVNQGEILCIIGPNGAGKTTLFNIISGVMRPSSGDVRFQGESIVRWSPQRIAAAGIARTYQIARPFARLCVRDNVAVAALVHERTLERARRAAQDVLESVGLATLADRPAGSLTLTQRKRLEVARALALRPKLLLLDEVMAGLTPTEIDTMAAFIEQLRERGIAAIGGVEHVMRVVMRISDRIAVLDFGKKIADGTPAEIVADSRVGEAYFGTSLDDVGAAPPTKGHS